MSYPRVFQAAWLKAAGPASFALVLFLAALLPAAANILNVPDDFTTVQNAIFEAVEGDEVVVAPGTYKGVANFQGKAITVRSTKPTDPAVVAATVLDGNTAAATVIFKSGEGPDSILTGLTITGANGAGVSISKGAQPTITKCVIQGNVTGVLSADNSAAKVTGNTIKDNEERGVVSDGATVITNNTIATNLGGGMKLTGAILVVGNLIVGNSTAGDGGGVACEPAEGTLVKLKSNLIINNTAEGKGGGVFCKTATDLEGLTISGNTAAADGGGGVYVADIGVNIHNCLITFALGGGGVAAAAADTVVAISFCDVFGNTGGNYVTLANRTGKNGNLSLDPLYGNASAGDFHLKSLAGRWDPATKTVTVSSPARGRRACASSSQVNGQSCQWSIVSRAAAPPPRLLTFDVLDY